MLVRIAGVNLPQQKHVVIALTHIYGVGRKRAQNICVASGISEQLKISKLTDSEVEALRQTVSAYTIEGDLRRETAQNIKRLVDQKTFRGLRHRNGLPVRGQGSHNNAKTQKRMRRYGGRSKVA